MYSSQGLARARFRGLITSIAEGFLPNHARGNPTICTKPGNSFILIGCSGTREWNGAPPSRAFGVQKPLFVYRHRTCRRTLITSALTQSARRGNNPPEQTIRPISKIDKVAENTHAFPHPTTKLFFTASPHHQQYTAPSFRATQHQPWFSQQPLPDVIRLSLLQSTFRREGLCV